MTAPSGGFAPESIAASLIALGTARLDAEVLDLLRQVTGFSGGAAAAIAFRYLNPGDLKPA